MAANLLSSICANCYIHDNQHASYMVISIAIESGSSDIFMPTIDPNQLPAQLKKLHNAAKQAWIFTLPLIEIATTRSRGAARGAQANTLYHVYKLADHLARDVTTPNNDTLYSTSQLDLSQGPVTFSLPVTGDRYFSLALMDAYSNNFAILGTRTTGPEGGLFQLVGPNDAAQVGENIIRCPTNHVWALARIVVDSVEDLQAARDVQSALTLQGPAVPAASAHANRNAPWQDYFSSADALMKTNPPLATDLALLRSIAPLGIGSGNFRAEQFNQEEGEVIEAGITIARKSLRGQSLSNSTAIDGWTYPGAALGDFGQSYQYRAAVALGGLAALPLVEAMYMNAVGEQGPLMDGKANWHLHFAADQMIPANSFWSLSLYEAVDGQFFFVDNSIKRYAIGDRTEGLSYQADGSLDIWIGHDNPGPERESNWLPAPAGPFSLVMRAYLPKPRLLEGGYRLPPVLPAEKRFGR